MILITLIYFLLILFVNHFLSKKNYLQSNTGLKHQVFVNQSVPLSGGFFITFAVIYIFFASYTLMTLTFVSLFALGLLSDINILSSSKVRLFLQFLILLFFVFLTHLEVSPTRIDFVDDLLSYSIVSYFFTIFCFLVFINGSNFIDGLNGLLLGYFILIFLFLFHLNLIDLIIFKETFIYLVLVFIFLLILNFSNKLFFGDSGAYSLSFLTGFVLIKIYNSNSEISPYFIILLLWYPCFENLFSILRKTKFKANPLKPDNKHLHQYLFIFLRKKFQLNKLISNNFASLLINFFNFLIFLIASKNINHTKIQLSLLLFCVIFYLTFYKVIKSRVNSL